MSVAYYPQVQKIFVAYYGRPADPAGLQYWAAQLAASGGSLASIINAFGNSAESTALYAGANNAAKVTAIYQQLFNRAPDDAGLNFYTAELQAGRMSAASIALNVANGAKGVDSTVLDNKLSVAKFFTDALLTDGAASVAYTGSSAEAAARALIFGIKNVADTSDVGAAIASIKSGGSAPIGQTFTLTTGIDDVSFAPGRATTVNAGLDLPTASQNTFTAGDVLIDPSDTDSDRLVLTLGADLAVPANVTVRNIETIEFDVNAVTSDGDTIFTADVSDFLNAKTYEFDVVAAGSAVNALEVSNMENQSTIKASADFLAVDVTAADKTDSYTLLVAGAGLSAASPIVVTNTAAAGNVKIEGAGHLNVDDQGATGLVSVEAGASLTLDSATANAVIATAEKGNLTVASAEAANLVILSAEEGNITVTKGGVGGSLTATASGTIVVTDAAGTESVNLKASGVSVITAGANIKTATLEGNGDAATFDFTDDAAALKAVVVNGSEDITIELDAGTASGELSVLDSGDGEVTLNVSGAGALDLSGGDVVDVLNITADLGNVELGVVSGQEVNLEADQTELIIAVGLAGNKNTNTVTLNLDDDSRALGGAVDLLTGLTVTQAASVTINAGLDTGPSGAANPSTIEGVDTSDTGADVTINFGVNGLEFNGTNKLDDGTLTLTGSGNVSGDSSGFGNLTAAALDASAVTGGFGTLTNAVDISQDLVPIIRTGSGADVLTLVNTPDTLVDVGTGKGADVLTLADEDYDGTRVAIDLGEGADTLVLQNGTLLQSAEPGKITLANVETIRFDDGAVIDGDLLSGKTYAVENNDSGSDGVTVNVRATDTSLSFAALVETGAAAKTLKNTTFTIDASANTGPITIVGFTDAINNILGAGSLDGDSLVGGNLADTFSYELDGDLFDADNAGIDTIVGGKGTDSLLVGEDNGDAFVIEADDSFANVSGVETILLNGDVAAEFVLGASAETAGIVTVDLADTGTASTVDASAYKTAGVTIDASDSAAAVAHTLTGGGGADEISGGDGADELTGGGGADSIVGGDGDDEISGGAGDDEVTGGVGDDTFKVASGTDTITDLGGGDAKGEGNGTDSDVLVVSAGAAAIASSVGFTALATTVNNGSVTINVTAGTEDIDLSAATGSKGFTVVSATDDNVTMIGSAKADTLTGGEGDDALTGGDGNDVFVITAGIDTIADADLATGDAFTVAADAELTAGEVEAFVATAATTNSGTVTINADEDAGAKINLALAGGTVGYTIVAGGKGDTITGSALADTIDLDTNGGDNVVTTGGGDDTVTGGAGADTITVTGGTVTIDNFGDGTDVLVVNKGATAEVAVAADFTAAASTILNGTTNLVMDDGKVVDLSLATGTAGASITAGVVSTITGTANADTITGGTGVDTVTTSGGVDIVSLGSGKDEVTIADAAHAVTGLSLNGGDADDTLVIDATDVDLQDVTITSFEVLEMTAKSTVTLTATQFNAFDTVTAADTDGITVTGLNAAELAGTDADDSYVFAAGDAKVAITDFATTGTDVLDFSGILGEAFTVYLEAGVELDAATLDLLTKGAAGSTNIANSIFAVGVSIDDLRGVINTNSAADELYLAKGGKAVVLQALDGEDLAATIADADSFNIWVVEGLGVDVETFTLIGTASFDQGAGALAAANFGLV
jgi:hypothetical protein